MSRALQKKKHNIDQSIKNCRIYDELWEKKKGISKFVYVGCGVFVSKMVSCDKVVLCPKGFGVGFTPTKLL